MKPIVFTEWQDALIRRLYSSQSFAVRRQLIKEIMPRLGDITKQQAYKRALALGILQPVKKTAPWTADEDAVLERWAHLKDATIQRKLSQAGFQRTVVAIMIRRKRTLGGLRQAKLDAGLYTACQAAALIGANSTTVVRWIAKGWLKATRVQHAMDITYSIKAADLRQFVIDYVAYCDLSRVDKYALIDLLCPHGAKAAGSLAA